MAIKRPPAYTGDKPHVFISYAHKDSERVYPIIEALQKKGVRVWYDEGLEVGGRWSEDIAENILRCDYMLCFISASFIASENCRNEIHMAADEKRGPLLIYLDRVDLPPEMRLQFGRYHALLQENYDSFEVFIDHIVSSDKLADCIEEGYAKKSAKESYRSSENGGYSSSNYSSGNNSSNSYSSSNNSSSTPSYSSRRYSYFEIPGFLQVLMLIVAIGSLGVSIISLFMGSRAAMITSIICAVVFCILFILIIVAVKNDWGFDYMSYSSGWTATAVCTGIGWAIAFFVAIYLLFTLYGLQDLVIRDQVLVKSYLNTSTVELPDNIVEIGEIAFGQSWLSRGHKVRSIVLPVSV